MKLCKASLGACPKCPCLYPLNRKANCGSLVIQQIGHGERKRRRQSAKYADTRVRLALLQRDDGSFGQAAQFCQSIQGQIFVAPQVSDSNRYSFAKHLLGTHRCRNIGHYIDLGPRLTYCGQYNDQAEIATAR